MARTLWLALVLGAAVGALAGVYLDLVRWTQDLIWDGTDPRLPGDGAWQVLLVCVVGGVLVGLIRIRHDKDSPQDLEDALARFDDLVEPGGEDAKPPVKVTWLLRAVLLGVVSLAFGASLGPEAPLLVLATSLGDRVARILRISRSDAALITASGALSGLFGGPLAAIALPLERGRATERKVRMIGVSLVAGTAGLVAMLLVFNGSGARYDLPPLDTDSSRALAEVIGWSALAAVPAAIVGILFLLVGAPMQERMRRLVPATVPRAALGGLVLGVCAMLDGLVLFSGEHQAQDLIDSAGDQAAVAFLAVVALKLVATVACMSTGWFGGQIFPTVFMGMAAALALAEVWSSIPVAAAAAAGGAAAASAVLRRPLATVLILLLFFPFGSLVPMIVGAAVGALGVSLLGSRAPESAPIGGQH